MSFLSTGVLLALLLVKCSFTAETFIDYQHLRDVEFSMPKSQQKLGVYYNIRPESGIGSQIAVLKLFRPEKNASNSEFINCTNHAEIDRFISFVVFTDEADDGSKGSLDLSKCSWFISFTQLRMILLRGDAENKYNGSKLIYWSDWHNRSVVIQLNLTHEPTSIVHFQMSSNSEKNLSRFVESDSLQILEFSVELPFSDVTIETHSNNMFSNGCHNLTGFLFRFFCLGLAIFCAAFHTQDTVTCFNLKPFKLYIIWYSTFRLITWAYVVFWDTDQHEWMERFVYYLYIGQFFLMVGLVRIRDPIVFYKKMLRCYHLLCFVDYMVLAACLSWGGAVAALFWYLFLFYAVPNLFDWVKDISEWETSLSIAIEAVAYHAVIWPGNINGIYHLALSEDFSKLRPLFMSAWFFFGFAAGLGVGVPLLACARYFLARSRQEAEIERRSKLFTFPIDENRSTRGIEGLNRDTEANSNHSIAEPIFDQTH